MTSNNFNKLEERAENYTKNQLEKIALIDKEAEKGISNYLESESGSTQPFILYGKRGSGKTLYATKLCQQKFDEIAHITYKAGGNVQLNGEDISPNELELKEYDAIIFDDFSYMFEAVYQESGENNRIKTDFSSLIKKAEELAKYKKVIITTDTNFDYWFNDILFGKTDATDRDIDIIGFTTKCGFTPTYTTENTPEKLKKRILNSYIKDTEKFPSYRMTNLREKEALEIFDQVDFDSKSENLMNKINSPREAVSFVKKFAKEKDGKYYLKFDTIADDLLKKIDMDKINNIEKDSKKVLSRAVKQRRFGRKETFGLEIINDYYNLFSKYKLELEKGTKTNDSLNELIKETEAEGLSEEPNPLRREFEDIYKREEPIDKKEKTIDELDKIGLLEKWKYGEYTYTRLGNWLRHSLNKHEAFGVFPHLFKEILFKYAKKQKTFNKKTKDALEKAANQLWHKTKITQTYFGTDGISEERLGEIEDSLKLNKNPISGKSLIYLIREYNPDIFT